MKQSFFKSLKLTPGNYFLLALIFAAVVFLGVFPVWYEGYWTTKLTEIMKFVILAVAWVVFSAPTGYMSLATAAFFGVGFYLASALSGTVPFLAIILMSGAAGFILALLVGALTLRLRGVYFCIFTFGLVLLISNVVREVERTLSGTRGRFVHTESIEIVYWGILGVCVLTILVAWLIRRSRHGLALTAIGQYEEAAAHSGINVVRTKVLVFAVSSIFMGMAGAVIATRRAYVDPTVAFHLDQSFLPVLMALFGGMASLAGPVVGAVVFTLIKEELATTWPEMFQVIFGVILIVSILFLPTGIVGLMEEMWRAVRGQRPLRRGAFIWCLVVPALGWIAILARLVLMAVFRIRHRPLPPVIVEEPFKWSWLVIGCLVPVVGYAIFGWFLWSLARRKMEGGGRALA
jgi:branched-chain amino acid transport system permease protein